MNNAKITVPANVATAIAHYVSLADTKHEAFADILSMGYEAERSEIILRYFDGNYDLLMEALICGYDVEKLAEEELLEYFNDHNNGVKYDAYADGITTGIMNALNILGINIAGVNVR